MHHHVLRPGCLLLLLTIYLLTPRYILLRRPVRSMLFIHFTQTRSYVLSCIARSGQRDAYTQLTRKVHPIQKPSLFKNDTSVQGTRLAAPLDSRHHSASLQSLQANKSSESPSARTMTESNVQTTHSLDPPQSVVNTTLRDHLIRSIKPRKRAPPNRAAMNGHPPHDGARVGPSLAVKLELIDGK